MEGEPLPTTTNLRNPTPQRVDSPPPEPPFNPTVGPYLASVPVRAQTARRQAPALHHLRRGTKQTEPRNQPPDHGRAKASSLSLARQPPGAQAEIGPQFVRTTLRFPRGSSHAAYPSFPNECSSSASLPPRPLRHCVFARNLPIRFRKFPQSSCLPPPVVPTICQYRRSPHPSAGKPHT